MSATSPSDRTAPSAGAVLDDRVVVVAGGAGEVGEGIVHALLAAGARVAVPSRSVTKLQQLRDHVTDDQRLVTFEGGLDDDAEAQRLGRVVVDRVGRPNAVFAALGRWWSGPRMVDLPSDRVLEVLDAGLMAHVRCARTFLPLLAADAGSLYVLVNGSGAREAVAGSGPANLSAAAQLMLKDVLVAEHEDPGRICTLLLDTPIATRSREVARREWLTADEVGRYCAWLASPAAGDVHGSTIVLGDRAQVDDLSPG